MNDCDCPGPPLPPARELAASNVPGRLAPECAERVFQARLDTATDFRADPFFYSACHQNASALCGDVKPGGGRVQACLVRPGMRVEGWPDYGIVLHP